MENEYTQSLTILQAAEALGVSPMTLRRWIKKGKIKAELVTGSYGREYRIRELPLDQTTDKKPLTSSLDIVKSLQERNEYLAAQVGYLQSELKAAQDQIKLLSAPGKPWYKRLFRR